MESRCDTEEDTLLLVWKQSQTQIDSKMYWILEKNASGVGDFRVE